VKTPFAQIDAFASRPFTGNPAGVMPLDAGLDDEVLQAIAQENNLSETAFYRECGDGAFELRWFTPEQEVDLCGHASLAASFVELVVRRAGRHRHVPGTAKPLQATYHRYGHR
jgi:PhzF family phenazine biosynthesis protein